MVKSAYITSTPADTDQASLTFIARLGTNEIVRACALVMLYRPNQLSENSLSAPKRENMPNPTQKRSSS